MRDFRRLGQRIADCSGQWHGPTLGTGMMPVLWLCGPSGVGKTTVAWEIYSLIRQTGTPVGYVDIDQLGMCYPEPPTDPGRYRMQAENLDAVVAAFQDAGVRCVVVSGVVDPVHGVYAEKVPHAALTVCRLRVDAPELTRRLVSRQGYDRMVAEALAEAEAMDAGDIGEACVDTSGLPVAEVVRSVQERIAGWPTLTDPHTSRRPAGPTGPPAAGTEKGSEAGAESGPVLWLCGATGVGKSTVGFGIYVKTTFGRKIPGAYVDLDQIGFVSPAPPDDPMNHRVKAVVLAALWRTFRAAGAEALTIVGPVEDDAAIKLYAEALPATTLTVCRLHAGRGELTRRIFLRRHSGSWAQPGDPLKGQSEEHLLTVIEHAAATAEALERAAIGDLRLDTDKLSADQAADAILAQTGWPRPQTA